MKSKNRWKWQCANSKVLILKLRTQQLKQGATGPVKVLRLFEVNSRARPDQLEEMLKGTSKPKEFVGVLREYRQAKPGAESALIILDEALQFNLSNPATLAVLIHQLRWMHWHLILRRLQIELRRLEIL